MTNEVKNVPELRFPEFDEEWEKKRLKDICKINPKFEDNFPSEFNYIDLESVKKGKIYKISKYTMHNAPSRAQRVAKQGDIFFQTVRPYQQNNFVFVDDSYPTVVSTGYAQLRSNLNPSYLYNLLLTTSFLNKVLVKCTGSNYPAINSSDLSNIQLKVTSNIDEQQKIGEFFSELDRQIELEEQKLEKLEEQKKGYMQKIFSQEIRFKDDNGNDYPNWENEKLGNLINEVNERTTSNNQYVLLSSTKSGLLSQEEYFKKQIGSKDSTGYKILRLNQLVLSPQNLWLGNINFNQRFNIGIVSPSYRIYNLSHQFDINFAKDLLKSPRYIYEYAQASEQGASVVRRNLNLELFYSIKISLPSIEEQRKIGAFLDKLDKLIRKQYNKIEVLKQRKKGLLQKMFI